ncbi:hypothetical protein BDW69DRAFT_186113 [Aspergillus filifer]
MVKPSPSISKPVDIKCAKTGCLTTIPGCISGAARGEDASNGEGNSQGHKDAEAFSICAMAMYNDAAYWYKYQPDKRNTDQE